MAAKRTCGTCNIEVRDQVVICRRCEQELRRRLVDQSAHRGELELELRREARKHEMLRAANLDWRIPFDDRASQLLDRQRNLLGKWVQLVAKLRPPLAGPWCSRACKHPSCATIRRTNLPGSAVAARSIWLAMSAGMLRRRIEARLILEAFRRLDRDVVALIDLPADRARIHVGPCPNVWPTGGGANTEHCPGQVHAHFPLEESEPCYMVCGACEERWPSWQWNRTGSRILDRVEQLEKQAELAKVIGGAA